MKSYRNLTPKIAEACDLYSVKWNSIALLCPPNKYGIVVDGKETVVEVEKETDVFEVIRKSFMEV